MTSPQTNYYLIYATANDSDYLVDYANLNRMCQSNPGVSKIHVYLVVSEVEEHHETDDVALAIFTEMLDKSPWFELQGVYFKDNVGRDFSSVQVCLKAVRASAKDHDVVMIRNRSAYGPFRAGWYAAYLDLLNSREDIGMVGNTINQSGHPDSAYDKAVITCHVQTYLYLARFEVLRGLVDDFPGARETDRLELINNGELGLSRSIMSRGYGLKCLQWPEHVFGMGIYQIPELPLTDIKHHQLGLPFEHRHSKVPYINKKLQRKWNWKKRFFQLKVRLEKIFG